MLLYCLALDFYLQDGLFLVTQEPNLVSNYHNAILTPNVIEFERLYEAVVGLSFYRFTSFIEDSLRFQYLAFTVEILMLESLCITSILVNTELQIAIFSVTSIVMIFNPKKFLRGLIVFHICHSLLIFILC